MHFKHTSAKIWPKYLKLVRFQFLGVRNKISMGG